VERRQLRRPFVGRVARGHAFAGDVVAFIADDLLWVEGPAGRSTSQGSANAAAAARTVGGCR